MELMHDEPLAKQWTKLSMAVKEKLVTQLARYQAQPFVKQYN